MLWRLHLRDQDAATPKALHLQSVFDVAGSCTRTGVLLANTDYPRWRR